VHLATLGHQELADGLAPFDLATAQALGPTGPALGGRTGRAAA
jgi:hypothetical protein